jgi:pilus assembly protein CpaE
MNAGPGRQVRIRVLIVPGRDPVGDWIANTIGAEWDMRLVGIVRDIAQAVDSIKTLAPDVILLDINSGVLQEGDLINRLASPLSGAAVIAVAMMGEVDAVQQAMLYGAQGFLLKPFGDRELLSSVRQAYELISQRRAEVSRTPLLTSGQEEETRPRAEIVAVFSPKGGVGCTTIAINLAVALKQATGQPVTLVDGDLRFGDVDAALNLTATSSLATLLPALDELDDASIRRALADHSSGIQVLVAPPYLDMADTIHPEQLSRLLKRLAELQAGYVVVDTWSALDDTTLTILDACQRLVVVTSPQITALRDAYRFLQVLGLLEDGRQKTMLVLNHCYRRSELKVEEVERILGRSVAQTIEYSPTPVTASLSRGVALVEAYGESAAARDILRLAGRIGDGQAGEPARLPEGAEVVAPKRQPIGRRGLFRGQARAKTAGMRV